MTMSATTGITCWADPLTRAERAELARKLARACKRFWDATDGIAPANGCYYSEHGHQLVMASAEMSDLHLDVTERAEVPAQ